MSVSVKKKEGNEKGRNVTEIVNRAESRKKEWREGTSGGEAKEINGRYIIELVTHASEVHEDDGSAERH